MVHRGHNWDEPDESPAGRLARFGLQSIWWAAVESNHVPPLYLGAPATLSVPAKLSNEAVKCRKRDASRQTDHNMQILRRRRRNNILVLAQGIEP